MMSFCLVKSKTSSLETTLPKCQIFRISELSDFSLKELYRTFLIATRMQGDLLSMDMMLPQCWYVCVFVHTHMHIFSSPLPIFFLAHEVYQAVTIYIELRSQASRLLAALATTTACEDWWRLWDVLCSYKYTIIMSCTWSDVVP